MRLEKILCVMSVTSKKRIEHIEVYHGTEFTTCSGNCTDRMYKENSFTCGGCETFLCVICSEAEIS